MSEVPQRYVLTTHIGDTPGELTPPQQAITILATDAEAEAFCRAIDKRLNDAAGYEDAAWTIATPITMLGLSAGPIETTAFIEAATAPLIETYGWDDEDD